MGLSSREQQLARSTSPSSLLACRRRSRQSSKWLLLSLFSLAALLGLVHREVALAQSPDQGASVSSISKMLRSIQQSACDGEQLSIKCNDDYIIDVITAVHTILPDTHNHVRDTKVTKSLAASSKDEQPEGEQRSATCPPTANNRTAAAAEQPAATTATTTATTTAQQPTSSSARGNDTATADAGAPSNWFVCDERQAQEQALAKETVSALVRTECHSRNSCTLDLRWPKLALDGQEQLSRQTASVTADYTTTVAATTPATSAATTPGTASQASTLKANGAKLSRLFNEACPLNRKLVEIVYKCRPLKMNRRTACRGSLLELECPAQKVLVVASPSNYGAWANDTKNHERCSQEAGSSPLAESGATSSLLAASKQRAANSTQLVAAAPQLMQHCLADSLRVASVLGANCLFQQSCKLEVTPQVFGTPNCPSGQVEYLKMIFTCVNETLIIAPNGGSPAGQSGAGGGSRGRPVTSQLVTQQQQRGSRQQQLDAFTSANVSSSSLLSSSITTTNVVVPANAPQQQPPQVSAQPSSVASGAGNPGESQQDQQQRQQQLLAPEQPRSATQLEGGPMVNRGYTIVTADSQLSANGGASSNPNHWSSGQRARFLLARYQPQVVIVGLCSLSLLVLAFVVRACRVGRRGDSRNSTTSSKDSKESACSTKSSTGFKSLCSSSSSSNAGGIGGAGKSNGNSGQTSKHNSCSESCFSLDDYNLQANQQSAANSPALPANSTPFDGALPAHLQGAELGHTGGARPKLWTIYGNEQHQHQHQQQRMMAAPHHTMRPTRTFVSQQQQHLRGAQCFHQLAQVAQLPQAAAQQGDQAGFQGRAGSVSNAAHLLLAMANQQSQQVGWCATLGQQQPSPVDRMTLLMQQQPGQQQQLLGNPLPPGPQCAFHASQQQQQQQQQMLFPPPASSLQLELPQIAGGAGNSRLAAAQQQQPLPPPQLQQQQAQLANGLRQFQANQFSSNQMQQQQPQS